MNGKGETRFLLELSNKPAVVYIVISSFLLMALATLIFYSLKPVSVLLTGTDLDDNSRHTDTMILAKFYPLKKELQLISIPRDTLVNVHGFGPAKINFAYAYGYSHGGTQTAAQLSKQTVEELLHEKIPFYIHLNYKCFIDLIDHLGGINILIEKDMNYDDHAGQLYIHFKEGEQLLNGADALKYVRFRHDGKGDIGRVHRQQMFLKAVWVKVKNPMMVPHLPFLLKDLLGDIDSNLSVFDILWLTKNCLGIQFTGIQTATLPGRPLKVHGIDYWCVDTQEAHIEQKNDIYQPAKNKVGIAKHDDIIVRYRVRILNGTGKSGITYQVVKRLRGLPFEIVHTGNAANFHYKQTQIKTCLKNKRIVGELSKIIGCRRSNLHYLKRLKGFDVEIIVGKDFRP